MLKLKWPFGKKKVVERSVSTTPFQKLFVKETTTTLKIGNDEIEVIQRHLTFPEQFDLENQVNAVTRELEARKNDPQVIVAASRAVRLEYMIFLSTYRKNGEKLFKDAMEVSDVLLPEHQFQLLKSYTDAFMLSEEERLNWWRDKTRV